MRKTVSSFLAGLIALLVLPTLLAAPAQAADRKIPCSVSGTFTVSYTSSDTRVTGNTNCTGAITIPAKVKAINSYAFFEAYGVTSVSFDSGSKLEHIGEMAFYKTKITSIVLPSGLKSMEWGPFRGTGVKTLSIPGTVTQLADGSFFGGPENVIFESRVATSLNIGAVTFIDSQSSVRSLTFKGPNQLQLDTSPGADVVDAGFSVGWSTTSDGPLVSFPLANTNPGDLTLYPRLTPKAGAAIVPCSLGGSFRVVDAVVTVASSDCAGEITIPADVTEISPGYNETFKGRNITKVTFEPGSQLRTIGGGAFNGTKFSTISLPGTVRDIGGDVFANSDLASLTLGDNKGEFDFSFTFWLWGAQGSLNNTPNLNSITFTAAFAIRGMPEIVKNDYRHLGWSTSPGGQLITYPRTGGDIHYVDFPAGTTLYNIMVPVVVTEIDCSLSGSFTQRDDRVTASTADCAGEITIPADVTQINDHVFDRRGLTKVAFAANSQLKTIGRDAFIYNNITDLVLPENLQYVGWNAFAGLKQTSITIPGKLDEIRDGAFHNSSLEEVTFASRVIQWNHNPFPAFGNNAKLTSLTFVGEHKIRWRSPHFDPDVEDLQKVSRGGYKWEGWSATKGGPIVSSWAPLSDNQVTTVLYPNWSILTFTANFSSNGGTPVAPSTIVGGQIQMPTPPTKAGYTFLGWTQWQDGGGDVEAGYWPYDGDYTFGAKWSANTYAVNLNTKGGTQVDPASFRTGGEIHDWDLPTPTRNCSAHAGWSATDGGAAIEFPHSPGVMSAITLFAKWTSAPCAVTAGEAENSQVVTVPAGTTEAVIPATEALPTVKLNLAGASGTAVVTVAPISNPAAPSSTPFKLTESTKIVDINITGVTGNVTVCLDGESTDAVFHFSGGKWVELPQRSYANGQVCGVTSNFSPFAAAAPAPMAPVVNNPAPVVNNPAPVVDNSAALAAAAKAQAAAKDLAARTITGKKTLVPSALAKKVGVKVVSSKAKVTMTVAGSSKNNCAVVAGKLKTLKAGNCVVSFTVQEPKPAKGKLPKATKATKTLVIK